MSTLPPALPLQQNAPPSINLELVAGPMFIAYLIHWGLFGILTVQCYIYYIAFPKDGWITKGTVALGYFLETVQVGFITYDGYRAFGKGWGNLLELDKVGLLWFGLSMMVCFVTTLCQHFYAWRIYGLTGRKWYGPSLIISLLSVIQLAFGIWNGVESFRVGRLSQISQSLNYKVALGWQTSTTVCDIIITTSMFYILWQAKRSTFSKQTTTVLTHLIKVTIETGFITAVCTTIELILFITKKHTTLYSVFLGTRSKLYSNALLAVLNSRVRIIGGRIQDIDINTTVIPTGFSTMRFANSGNSTFRSRSNASRDEVSGHHGGIVEK
ncbi:hypothetical protein BXZ70DRAFT_498943 [Cristinia sonorae]|uniref:DUF6534 domain-containing protein n=1 Tax=Cristinia sonorae TaxID=1940300 RepID=A0A8K0XLG7_9AGAR|nr:hypothetical protein BXZ70DRAFT_498943 [Cristinia sonorae]